MTSDDGENRITRELCEDILAALDIVEKHLFSSCQSSNNSQELCLRSHHDWDWKIL